MIESVAAEVGRCKTAVVPVIVARDGGGFAGGDNCFEEVYLSSRDVNFSFNAVKFVAFALSVRIMTSFSLAIIAACL